MPPKDPGQHSHSNPYIDTMRPFTVAVATLFFFVVYVEAGGCPFHNHDTPRPTEAYQLMTAAQKQEYLWNQVTANTRNRKWYSLFEEAHIYTEDMGTTFSAQQARFTCSV